MLTELSLLKTSQSSNTELALRHKRHNALSFHRVREATAGKFVAFDWIDGSLNPADILSKHWGYQVIWPLLQALLFWEGDTVDLFDHQKCKQAEHRSKSGLINTEQSNLAKMEKSWMPSLRRMLCGAMPVVARHNRRVTCCSLFVFRQCRLVVDDDHRCPRSIGCVTWDWI
jgi:hypothetical protein